MQYKKLKLCALLLLGLGLTGLRAQDAITASGGNASGSGGSVSYSVGQVLYSTSTAEYGSVAEGVQQPYEISGINGVDETGGINLDLSVSPNPTADFLLLTVKDFKFSSFNLRLFDISGKLLLNQNVSSAEMSITM